jgi:hypothetical protein
MPIPELNEYGFLAVGTHLISVGEIQERFAQGDPIRAGIWPKFLPLFEVIQQTGAFQAVEFFGSFFSRKSEPADFDPALELKLVDVPVACINSLFDREALRRTYQADVLVKDVNAAPYRAIAPANYPFASAGLYAFRRVKPEQMADVIRVDRRPPELGREYRGVLRVDLTA